MCDYRSLHLNVTGEPGRLYLDGDYKADINFSKAFASKCIDSLLPNLKRRKRNKIISIFQKSRLSAIDTLDEESIKIREGEEKLRALIAIKDQVTRDKCDLDEELEYRTNKLEKIKDEFKKHRFMLYIYSESLESLVKSTSSFNSDIGKVSGRDSPIFKFKESDKRAIKSIEQSKSELPDHIAKINFEREQIMSSLDSMSTLVTLIIQLRNNIAEKIRELIEIETEIEKTTRLDRLRKKLKLFNETTTDIMHTPNRKFIQLKNDDLTEKLEIIKESNDEQECLSDSEVEVDDELECLSKSEAKADNTESSSFSWQDETSETDLISILEKLKCLIQN